MRRINANFCKLLQEDARQAWAEFYDCMNEDGTIDGEKLAKYIARTTPKASQKDGLEAAYGANHGKIGAFTGEF